MRDTDEWVVIDTETTGLSDPVWAVEIAAQRMRGWRADGEPFRVLLNHDVEIEPEAEALHGYSRAFLRKHGENPATAHEWFRSYAGSRPVISYNRAFDWNRVLVQEFGGVDALVCGGDRAAVDAVLADPRLARPAARRTDLWLPVPDPRRAVLDQAVRDARAAQVTVTEPGVGDG